MPLTDYIIKDLESFKVATREPRQVAGIYFFMVLDCLFELSYKISHDFFASPDRYKNLKSENSTEVKKGLAPTIARLHARYGHDELLPSQEQRKHIYEPLFGDIGAPPGRSQVTFARAAR